MLPFANMSGDPDQEYFADGMVEEVITALSRTLHPDKTRLIQFGRRAAEERERAGLSKPETFDFLDFTHICGRSRRVRFLLFRRTRRDRKRAKIGGMVHRPGLRRVRAGGDQHAGRV